MSKNNKTKTHKHAVTFMEVAVMIIILSIISSIVGVKLSRSLRDKKFKLSVNQISQLVSMARVQNQFNKNNCLLEFNDEDNTFLLSVFENKPQKLKMLFGNNKEEIVYTLKKVQLPDTIRVERFFEKGFERLSGGSFKIPIKGFENQSDEYAIQLTQSDVTKYIVIQSNSKVKIVDIYPIEIVGSGKE